jgi:hypothetical protein
MYNAHRGMVPQGGPSQRLNELLEQIRAEFETESQRNVDYEGQSECLPSFVYVMAMHESHRALTSLYTGAASLAFCRFLNSQRSTVS